MGLFDSCIQRLPSESSGLEPYEPTSETCRNCHDSSPSEATCPAQIDWPESLYRPLEAIAREPERLRWWVQENRLRTDLRRRGREETFPVELGAHSMRIEIDPNERNLDSTFVDSDTRFFMNLSGEGMRVFLNSSRLLEGRELGWIGSLRIFFEENHLTSDSTLLNWFVPPHANVLSMIPVAYDEASGVTYDYTQYTRMALIESQCGAPTAPGAYTRVFDGGVPPPSEAGTRTLDGSVALDLPPEILSEMRRSAPNLGTGYADAGCGYSEALPRRFPYLFELAHHFATSHSQASRIDLLRLYPDLLLLQRLNARLPSSGSETDFMSFLDRVRVDWNVAPIRVALQNFLLEFHPDTAEHPLSVGMEVRGRRLPSLETDSRVHLSRLYVPGWIHLGETRARLQGTGPELSLHLTEIDGEILPFDLGQEDPAARGFLHIRGGSASDGEGRSLAGVSLQPGIHLETESDGSIRYSVNLRVSWNVELSEGLVLNLSGNLAASGRLIESGSHFEPEPGSTVIALQDLRLAPKPWPGKVPLPNLGFRAPRWF